MVAHCCLYLYTSTSTIVAATTLDNLVTIININKYNSGARRDTFRKGIYISLTPNKHKRMSKNVILNQMLIRFQ